MRVGSVFKWFGSTGKAAFVSINVLGGDGCSLSRGVLRAESGMDSAEEREDKVTVYGGE